MNFYLRCLSVLTATILLSLSIPIEMTGNTWGSSPVVAQTRGDHTNEGLRLLSVGIDLQKAGQLKEALAAFEKALVIARETGDRSPTFRPCSVLSLLYELL